MIRNPFLTYGYNGPEYFCDRVEEAYQWRVYQEIHLASASAVQRSLSALQEKDILTNNNGQYYVYDYFLYDWLNSYSK